jgi:hypothetical protein
VNVRVGVERYGGRRGGALTVVYDQLQVGSS